MPKAEKITVISIRGMLYLTGSDTHRRSNECPMPQICVQTQEMSRSPMDVLKYMAGISRNMGTHPLCFAGCKLECPIKEKTLEMLKNVGE